MKAACYFLIDLVSACRVGFSPPIKPTSYPNTLNTEFSFCRVGFSPTYLIGLLFLSFCNPSFPVVLIQDKHEIVFEIAKIPKECKWSDNFQAHETHFEVTNVEPHHSELIWFQTQPIALKSSYRPTIGFSLKCELKGKSNEKSPMDIYIRYSIDRVHWSGWFPIIKMYCQNPSKIEKYDNVKVFTQNQETHISVPRKENKEFKKIMAEWRRKTDPKLGHDVHACCEWLAETRPEYFQNNFPFIGYVQFLLERDRSYGDSEFYLSLEKFTAQLSYGLSGLLPDKEGIRENLTGPWFFDLRDFISESNDEQ